jgi:ubiquinone/menaquinone biosynthesis C-methylase UbiE
VTQPGLLSQPEPWNLVAPGYVAESLASFEAFADDALRLSELPADSDVLDVAAGPGSLALLAAARTKNVTAVDFSEGMLSELRARLASTGVHNVNVTFGDGQHLPFSEASFDRAYSMFGLMFFPDRAAGFRELFRVLRQGGRVAVSSWVPFDRVLPMATLFSTLNELLPDLGFNKASLPLGNPGELTGEMAAAGFERVRVHEVSHAVAMESAQRFWQGVLRSNAPLLMLRNRLGEERWAEVSNALAERLTRVLGEGPIEVEYIANIAVGTKL